jgi:hypothetical protein
MPISILQVRPLRRPFVLTEFAPVVETSALLGCPVTNALIGGDPRFGGALRSSQTVVSAMAGDVGCSAILVVASIRLRAVEDMR